MANSTHQVPFTRTVVRFVSSCTPIERHILPGKPLTDTEMDLISNTEFIIFRRGSGGSVAREQSSGSNNHVYRRVSRGRKWSVIKEMRVPYTILAPKQRVCGLSSHMSPESSRCRTSKHGQGDRGRQRSVSPR